MQTGIRSRFGVSAFACLPRASTSIMTDSYRTIDEVKVISERDNLYRTIDEMARQMQLLSATVREVKFFFGKFKVADGGQGNPSLVVANGADAVSAAWAVANARSTVEELNTLTNSAFEMVGWKSNSSHVQEASSSSQGGSAPPPAPSQLTRSPSSASSGPSERELAPGPPPPPSLLPQCCWRAQGMSLHEFWKHAEEKQIVDDPDDPAQRFVRLDDGRTYCLLCFKAADKGHLTSNGHMNRTLRPKQYLHDAMASVEPHVGMSRML